jgi:Tol biopolymer transport system component
MNAMGTVPGRNGRIAFSTGGVVFTARPDGSGVKVVTAGSAPVWSPNGKRIAYVWSNSVYTLSAAGGGKRERRLVIANARSPTWSPRRAERSSGSSVASQQVPPLFIGTLDPRRNTVGGGS